MKLDATVLEQLKQPILSVWQQVGYQVQLDCEEMGERLDNISALECCIDADRLRYEAGNARAQKLVDQLCEQHGYDKVLKFLSRNIRLA
jgi:hypothetical protein